MSGHAGNLIGCLDYAIDTDIVDAILVAYNFGQDPKFYETLTRSFDFVAVQPDLPRVLAKAKAKRRRRRHDEDVDGRAPERHAPL